MKSSIPALSLIALIGLPTAHAGPIGVDYSTVTVTDGTEVCVLADCSDIMADVVSTPTTISLQLPIDWELAYGGDEGYIPLNAQDNPIVFANVPIYPNTSVSVPEPGTFFLLASGLVALLIGRRRLA